jgi:hypothetical protein
VTVRKYRTEHFGPVAVHINEHGGRIATWMTS